MANRTSIGSSSCPTDTDCSRIPNAHPASQCPIRRRQPQVNIRPIRSRQGVLQPQEWMLGPIAPCASLVGVRLKRSPNRIVAEWTAGLSLLRGGDEGARRCIAEPALNNCTASLASTTTMQSRARHNFSREHTNPMACASRCVLLRLLARRCHSSQKAAPNLCKLGLGKSMLRGAWRCQRCSCLHRQSSCAVGDPLPPARSTSLDLWPL
jgi:hypothetical protein